MMETIGEPTGRLRNVIECRWKYCKLFKWYRYEQEIEFMDLFETFTWVKKSSLRDPRGISGLRCKHDIVKRHFGCFEYWVCRKCKDTGEGGFNRTQGTPPNKP